MFYYLNSTFLFIVSMFFFLNSSLAQHHPQFVHLAFDGSKSLSMWKETRQFSKDASSKLNAPVEFTYFISGVYFLMNSHKSIYHPPKKGKGSSDIGFADNDQQNLIYRMEQVELALQEGHEIASHANGHFDGTSFSTQDWIQEFNEFEKLIFGWVENNSIPFHKIHFPITLEASDIKGFRAPLLGISNQIWPALAEKNFLYDTSKVSTPHYWPEKNNLGTWNFPLASLKIARTQKNTLSMDYNFYVAQTKAQSIDDPNQLKEFEDQTYETYMNYFEKNYNGNRAPIHIGHHFSKWNKGIYWNAMKRFALSVCGRPEVLCVTYSKLVDYLESQDEPSVALLNYSAQFPSSPSINSLHAQSPYRQTNRLHKKERLLTEIEIENLGLIRNEHELEPTSDSPLDGH